MATNQPTSRYRALKMMNRLAIAMTDDGKIPIDRQLLADARDEIQRLMRKLIAAELRESPGEDKRIYPIADDTWLDDNQIWDGDLGELDGIGDSRPNLPDTIRRIVAAHNKLAENVGKLATPAQRQTSDVYWAWFSRYRDAANSFCLAMSVDLDTLEGLERALKNDPAIMERLRDVEDKA